jgi:hypothetical protein
MKKASPKNKKKASQHQVNKGKMASQKTVVDGNVKIKKKPSAKHDAMSMA